MYRAFFEKIRVLLTFLLGLFVAEPRGEEERCPLMTNTNSKYLPISKITKSKEWNEVLDLDTSSVYLST